MADDKIDSFVHERFGGSAFVWLLVCLLLTLPMIAQDTNAEAKLHYKVALIALEKNDFATATEEFQNAIKLSPNNAILYYNLAVVRSKADDPLAARTALQTATRLVLPSNLQDKAADLFANITYALRVKAKAAFTPYVGTWHGAAEWDRSYTASDGSFADCTNRIRRSTTVRLSVSPDNTELNGDLTIDQSVVSRGCAGAFVKFWDGTSGTFEFSIHSDWPKPETTRVKDNIKDKVKLWLSNTAGGSIEGTLYRGTDVLMLENTYDFLHQEDMEYIRFEPR